MDENISCPNTSTCLLNFLRRKYSKQKNNVYNIESGRITAGHSKSKSNDDDHTYVKFEKYRPSINEEYICLELPSQLEHTSVVKPVRYSKLKKNLSKNLNESRDPPQFINELEENSKKIESSFHKCNAMPAEKDYEQIREAVKPMFKDTDELKPLPRRKRNVTKSVTSSSSTDLNENEFEHIKLALQMMFSNVDVQTRNDDNKVSDSPPSNYELEEDSANTSKRIKKTETKLQHIVEDVLKSKSILGKDESEQPHGGVIDHSSKDTTSCDDIQTDEQASEGEGAVICDQLRTDAFVSNETRFNVKVEQYENEYNTRRKPKSSRRKKCEKTPPNLPISTSSDENDEQSFFSKQKQVETNVESSLPYGSVRASVDPIDAILWQMRADSEKQKELENEHTAALTALREKQNELQCKSNSSASDRIKLCQNIEAFQSKIRELEKKMELQRVRHEELLLEMAAIGRDSVKKRSLSRSSNTGSWSKSNASNEEVQTSPDSNTSGYRTSIAPNTTSIDLRLHQSYRSRSEPVCTCPVSLETQVAMSSNESACSEDSGIQNTCLHPNNNNIRVDVDKIMAKIDQDNRVLAELDKIRSTIATQGCMTAEQFRNISEIGGIPSADCQQMLATLPSSSSQTTLQQPPALGNAFSTYVQQMDMRPSLGPSTLLNEMQHSIMQSMYNVMQPEYRENYSDTLPFALKGARNIKNGTLPNSNFASTSDLLLSHEDLILERHHQSFRSQDMIEVPGKGLCNIFIAKYYYDPFSQSSNICPEAELTFSAGDYLLVYGEPDDDGFVDAELMDGQRGLVPIIFIQKLSGDELLQFKRRLLTELNEIDDGAVTMIPQDILNLHIDEDSERVRREYNSGTTTDYKDEETANNHNVPAPKQLTLERQLNKSILIRWNTPDESCHDIDSYHVYVDGVLKTTVKANDRTKALLEGVDSTKSHRISIRSVALNRMTSKDAACTMLIGKHIPCYPTDLRAYHITSTSAVISWLPSNSNFQHTVCVNNIEVRIVKSGTYMHTITGLVPNTIYRVSIRAKNIRAPQYDVKLSLDKFASHLDFRTLPKDVPEPPADIQMDLGPQDGTLLVTWTPVTTENSNGAPITGYAVYADGKKVTEIDSPTGDHALIDIDQIQDMNPRHLTVRTKSGENYSNDSNVTLIPASALEGKHIFRNTDHSHHGRQEKNMYGQVIIDPDENLSDKEVYPNQQVPASSMGLMKKIHHEDNYSEEEFLEKHRSNRNRRYHQTSPQLQESSGQRNMQRPNYNSRTYDVRRENREHQSRTGDRRKPNDHHIPDEKPRFVIAIFDSNPTTSHEELNFAAGDRIKVLSDLDPDGFYWAECHGKQGFVAQNMIQELDTVHKGNRRGVRVRSRHPPQHLNISNSRGTRTMVALYDFSPQDHSSLADCDGEVSFAAGQIIYVKGEPDDDGFYLGEVNGVQGLVPSNFLQEVEQISDKMNHRGPRNQTTRARNRGHGLGARGPPPPPRDGRQPRGDLRETGKDMKLQYENEQDQLKSQEGFEDPLHQERRTDRDDTCSMGPLNEMNQRGTFRGSSSRAKRRSNDVPDISASGKSSTAQAAPSGITLSGLKFPESANLLQKLGEVTGTSSSQNPSGSIFSKSKELIFTKFGIGKS